MTQQTPNNYKDQQKEGDIPASDITKEKSIFDVLKLALKLPKSRFNIKVTTAFVSALSIYATYTKRPTEYLILDIREWGELGFGFSGTILGFLIAGLALLAAVDVRFFYYMSKRQHRCGMSYLKYTIVSFMYVFIVYLALAFISLCIRIMLVEDGIISLALASFGALFYCLNVALITEILVRVFYVFFASLLFYSLVLLTTFIFNVYYLMMSNVRWYAEGQEDKGFTPERDER